MLRAYSSDLRIRVIRAVEDGSSARGAARRLGVGESTATAWVGRWRRTGSAAAKSQKGRSRSPLNRHADWLLGLTASAPISHSFHGLRLPVNHKQIRVFPQSVNG